MVAPEVVGEPDVAGKVAGLPRVAGGRAEAAVARVEPVVVAPVVAAVLFVAPGELTVARLDDRGVVVPAVVGPRATPGERVVVAFGEVVAAVPVVVGPPEAPGARPVAGLDEPVVAAVVVAGPLLVVDERAPGWLAPAGRLSPRPFSTTLVSTITLLVTILSRGATTISTLRWVTAAM